MKLSKKQIEVLDKIAMGEKPMCLEWKTLDALKARELITHNDATWKYPDPYYHLTDLGLAEWTAHTVV